MTLTPTVKHIDTISRKEGREEERGIVGQIRLHFTGRVGDITKWLRGRGRGLGGVRDSKFGPWRLKIFRQINTLRTILFVYMWCLYLSYHHRTMVFMQGYFKKFIRKIRKNYVIIVNNCEMP